MTDPLWGLGFQNRDQDIFRFAARFSDFAAMALPICGYADHLWAKAGDSVGVKVSSVETKYRVRFVRSISADPNPRGLGIVEEPAEHHFASCEKTHGRVQDFYPGSYAESVGTAPLQEILDPCTISCFIFPTLRKEEAHQTIVSIGDVLSVTIDKSGSLALHISFGSDVGYYLSMPGPAIRLRTWWKMQVNISSNGSVELTLHDCQRNVALPTLRDNLDGIEYLKCKSPVHIRIGARPVASENAPSHIRIGDCFNGKIEEVRIGSLLCWDFSDSMSSTVIKLKNDGSTSPFDLHLVNYPTRAVTGVHWNGTEMCWRHAPEHYAAIHFHDDDIYDFGWETDFSFVVPSEVQSGLYYFYLENDSGYDAIPLFIVPTQPKARVAVVASTFTYVIYGNHSRPDFDADSWTERTQGTPQAYPYNPAQYPQYGLSTYNCHSDGSGICHASHLRPLLNLRPGFLTWSNTTCSGLRHIPADTHLLSWLEHKKIDYDLLTDEFLHENPECLRDYKAVLTVTHPEYHTTESLDALQSYRDNGGSLLYLGGNGFYWRIARHRENPAVLEIRRAEGGIRAWASEPGEYYHAFDGSYGGLWRRIGRPPQQLVGVGFTAQGGFRARPFKRVCYHRDWDWLFKGIGDDTKWIGEHGFSGNGAAGFELDRVDARLGADDKIVILAQSMESPEAFVLVHEEQLTHVSNLSGVPNEEILRADMIWLETTSGGRVFAVGSITFCGCLPWNQFDNNISTLLWNVISHLS